jgi:dTDP-D-glucose 4,6-dehydratase
MNGRNSDNTLIQRYLHWKPDTALREGLEKTYAWFTINISRDSAVNPASCTKPKRRANAVGGIEGRNPANPVSPAAM